MFAGIILVLLALFSLLALFPTPLYDLWKPEIAATEAGHAAALLAAVVCFFVDRKGLGGKIFLAVGLFAILAFISPMLRAFVVTRTLPEEAKAAFGVEGGIFTKSPSQGQEQPLMPSRWLYLAGDKINVQRFSIPIQPKGSLLLDLYLPPGEEPRLPNEGLLSTSRPTTLGAKTQAGNPPPPLGLKAQTGGPKKKPLVVVIHGGSWRSGDLEQLPSINRYLAQRGIFVAAITYRLAPEYRFPTQIEDVETNLRWLRERAEVLGFDKDRIALVGRSAGGHLALLGGYRKKIPGIRGVISFYGPVDMHWSWQNPTNPWVYDTPLTLREFLGGSPSEVPAAYDAASPIRLVDASTPPTLLLHGAKDGLVSIQQARRLSKVLQAYKIRHLSIELPWATHAFEAHLYSPSGQISLYGIERFLASVFSSQETRR